MTTLAGVGESRLIELIQPYLSSQAGKDDAAVLDPVEKYAVVSTDMSVEGVHFDLSWMSAEDAGWRALAFALGDLAAKGASPVWALTSVAAPVTWDVGDFVGLFKGMHRLATRFEMAIEGGDLSSTDGPVVLSVTVGGYADTRPLPRSAARPGWSIAVTGPLGGSAVALRERRVLLPEPLIEMGRRLNAIGLCCGDVSDGLVREMEKFAEMAGVGFHIDATKIPVADRASVSDALSSGEEVQLVCVGPSELLTKAALEAVGVITERGFAIDGCDDVPRGYDHFA